MTLSLPVYVSSRRVRLPRRTLDWAVLRLEGILVCAGQGKTMDEEISRYVEEDRFLNKSLIVRKASE